jgi:predicted ATPase
VSISSRTSWPRWAEICRCLDGLPLAIELAAAPVRMMEPAEIAQRLVTAWSTDRSGPHRRGAPPHATSDRQLVV